MRLQPGRRCLERAASVFCCMLLAAPAVSSSTVLRGGPFEASGATYVNGGGGILFVDDARPTEVLWLPLNAAGEGGDVRVVPIGVAVSDPEGITTDGAWVYVVGSQSRGKGASLVRFKFDSRTKVASAVESLTGLSALLHEAAPEIRGATRGKKRLSALNVEGLAWDPEGRLLLGIRSPVVDGKALVVPLRVRDRSKPLTAENIVIEKPLRIDLGGSGIRAIEHDAAAGGFQIIAGHPTGGGESRLVLWSDGDGRVQELRRFSRGEKPEGVTPVSIGGKPATLVVFDTSRFSILR